MPKVNYPLDRFGFHFANRFRNVLAELPGSRKIELNGRCGGMSFASLDYFFAGLTAPACKEVDLPRETGVPPDGSPLSDYIMRRHLHSLAIPATLNVFVWSVLPDRSTFFVKGVHDLTMQVELPKLRTAINQGRPVPLILIHARDLGSIGLNHQVVAYGYEEDAAGLRIFLYDCNHPDEEATLTSNGTATGFTETCPSGQCNEDWRGFFVHPVYAQLVPGANLSPLLPARAIALAGAADGVKAVSFAAPARATRKRATPLTVTFDRVTFVNEQDPDTAEKVVLAFTVNDKTSRWPRTGAKVASDGKSYAVRKRVPVTVAQDDILEIGVALADGPYASLAEEGEPVGSVTDLYAKAGKWGRGKHVARSAGLAGGYIVEYTIAGAGAGKRKSKTQPKRKTSERGHRVYHR